MTTRRTLLTAALSLGLAAWTAGSAHAQETIRAVTDATFPPMEFVKDGKRTGFDIELVEAGRRHGQEGRMDRHRLQRA